jgi:hypothetical protein
LLSYVTGDYQSFKSIYDSYENRIKIIYKKIYDSIIALEDFVKWKKGEKENDTTYLKWYITEVDYDFKEYGTKIKEEDYENKYCIYWYRYEPNAATPDEEPRFLDKKWKRITKNDKLGGRDIINLGVP